MKVDTTRRSKKDDEGFFGWLHLNSRFIHEISPLCRGKNCKSHFINE